PAVPAARPAVAAGDPSGDVRGGFASCRPPLSANFTTTDKASDLTQSEMLALMCIAYFQPITRAELSSFFGKEINRDLIGHLRGAGLIASGPRNPRLVTQLE